MHQQHIHDRHHQKSEPRKGNAEQPNIGCRDSLINRSASRRASCPWEQYRLGSAQASQPKVPSHNPSHASRSSTGARSPSSTDVRTRDERHAGALGEAADAGCRVRNDQGSAADKTKRELLRASPGLRGAGRRCRTRDEHHET